MTTDDFQPLTAPPIGLRPRHIWNDIHPTPGRDAIHERIQEILAAVGRYLVALCRALGLGPRRFGDLMYAAFPAEEASS